VKLRRRDAHGYGESDALPRPLAFYRCYQSARSQLCGGCLRKHTCGLGSARSRSAFGSGAVAFPWLLRELNELFTLLPGVGVCDCDCGPGRFFSTSRMAPPLGGAPTGGAGPWEEVVSRVAAGSALDCCLFFLPKRKDMASD